MTRKEETFAKVQSVLNGAFELPIDRITPEAQLFRDLGLDSLDAVDLAVRLKCDTGLSLTEIEMRSIRTVGDIVEVVDARLRAMAPQ
jgi:acyl carrier protein